ncbi:TetR/AcrR family transcriptional regulator [Sphingomonas oligophenolica]|uniref:TetR/AcrR family transcriptional regulator n=2 Tax=Sphingomonas oligophenolica TaxID=301154 RepID=A0ABU9Y1Y7_9SPHN
MGRPNQKRRTRKDLLQAAARLMKQGSRPSLEEVAEEALVSRATAYRYFPSIEAVLLEAALDLAAPEPGDVFGAESPDDPFLRLRMADVALDAMIVANEGALRVMLANSLNHSTGTDRDSAPPTRQNRRTPLIEAAIEPVRDQFDPVALDRMSKALALIIGTEARVVFTDVLQLDDADARAVKDWAIRALVAAARQPVPDTLPDT